MSEERSRPADVVLDLLRDGSGRGVSVRYLVEAGSVFGFTENTVRVTISRLLGRGLIDSPARGRYRLAQSTDPVNDFVEDWRLGERRVCTWHEDRWWVVHATRSDARNRWALEALGLREVRPGLFARPDNLALEGEQLRTRAMGLGAHEDLLWLAAQLPASESRDWFEHWNPVALDASYEELARRLRESAARMPAMSLRDARMESFRLGGSAIHALAKDPLLPAGVVDVAARAELHALMLDYDRQGKAVWAASREEQGTRMPIPQLDSVTANTN